MVASDFRSMPSCFIARLQQQPALVDRTAGDRELAPLRSASVWIGDDGRHHHRAERAGIGIERQLGAELAFARHPQPVRDHDVGIAGAQRDLAGLGARELDHLDREISLLVEPVRADDGQFPGEGSGLLHRNADGLRGDAGG